MIVMIFIALACSFSVTLLTLPSSSLHEVSITSVPELIAAALLAGLPAHYGLTTAWIICLVTSAVGGIRGLISGVTPSLAIILVSLVQTSGVGYAIYAALFASLFQMAVGVLKIGEFIRFIPYPVMVGFLTGTALLIVLSQLTFFQEPTVLVQGQSRPFYNLSYQMNAFTAFTGGSWVTPSSAIVMIIEALMTLIISIALPRFTKVIPSILVALIVVTGIGEWAIARSLGFSGTLVGELATINTPSWPMIFFFDKSIEIPPLNMDTFLKIWPTGIAIFFISQVQNILALKHIRSVNRDNESDVNLVSLSQGVGQFISSMCGGMAGSVMISQSVILHECGGVNNLSVFSAGILIFGVCAGAYTALSIVPIGFIIGINVFAVSFFLTYPSCLVLKRKR
jgi:SulP family sulfate permease